MNTRLLIATVIGGAAIAPASAFAEGWGVETRIFHTNQHVPAKTMKVDENGGSAVDIPVEGTFENTAGVGLDATYSLSAGFDLGLGYSLARFHPKPSASTEEQVISAFTRWNAIRTDSLEVYGLVGASQHQLKNDTESGRIKTWGKSAPIYNYDLGFGGFLGMQNLGLGPLKVGLEYKYSSTFLAAEATGRISGVLWSPASDSSDRINTRIEKLSVINHELVLIFAFTI
ncbi:MAG: hypothetical protein M3Q07_06400 [Pseudobdellovibrionaceae bacterium]|nr:hypothetical protein [Pseudobdellovibrionaceae bacterium]